MEVPTTRRPMAACGGVSDILGHVGDKWTVQVVVSLRDRPRRFNDLKRQIEGVSQQMLTRTLKSLERDGMVDRTVQSSTPPQVTYTLTTLGRSLSVAVRQLADWAVEHRGIIRENRLCFEKKAVE